MTDEDLAPVYEAWRRREVGKWSWVVPVEDIIENDYDMTARNPNRNPPPVYPEPAEIVESIYAKEKEIGAIIDELRGILSGGRSCKM